MIFLLAIFASGCQSKQDSLSVGDIAILPKPVHLTVNDGLFEIRKNTKIVVDPETRQMGEMLKTFLSPSMGFELVIKEGKDVQNSIRLSLDPALKDKNIEGYQLAVDKNGVLIEAISEAGIFYGMQTLRQLLPAEIFSEHVVEDIRWALPCVEIKDFPRFKWRGMHLDVARHFLPVEFVKNTLT